MGSVIHFINTIGQKGDFGVQRLLIQFGADRYSYAGQQQHGIAILHQGPKPRPLGSGTASHWYRYTASVAKFVIANLFLHPVPYVLAWAGCPIAGVLP